MTDKIVLGGSQLVSGELVAAVLLRGGKASLLFVDDHGRSVKFQAIIACSVQERMITPEDASKTDVD